MDTTSTSGSSNRAWILTRAASTQATQALAIVAVLGVRASSAVETTSSSEYSESIWPHTPPR